MKDDEIKRSIWFWKGVLNHQSKLYKNCNTPKQKINLLKEISKENDIPKEVYKVLKKELQK